MNDQSYSQLLSHIVSRWSNRTEDIAVDALGFILSRSRAARNALQGVVEALAPSVGELTSARTQVSSSDGARPDLVVYGSEDRERVIVEAKFWAGLTDNQPESYLARLPDDGETSVLLFVAPEARLETLWIELRRRTRHDAGVADRSEVGGVKCMPIDSGQRYLVLSSWRMVLDRMLTSAVASASFKFERPNTQASAGRMIADTASIQSRLEGLQDLPTPVESWVVEEGLDWMDNPAVWVWALLDYDDADKDALFRLNDGASDGGKTKVTL